MGGAVANSEHFPAMATNSKSRAKFVESLVEFCKTHHLDGADIDWEYPESKREKDNALLLFKALSKSFRTNDLVLTAAVNYKPDQVQFAKSIEKYVDKVHLMAYEPVKGLNTFQEQLDYAMDLIQKEQLNSNKTILGLPFYGRNRSSGKALPYYKMMASKEEDKQFLDSIDYLDTNEMDKNVRNIKQSGLAGIMFWELGFDMPLDSSLSLLMSINNCLKKKDQN